MLKKNGFGMVLIDVRTDEEFAAGHRECALHFALSRLEAGELPALPKDTALEVYCRSGGRSERAKDILSAAGFVNVVNGGGFRN